MTRRSTDFTSPCSTHSMQQTCFSTSPAKSSQGGAENEPLCVCVCVGPCRTVLATVGSVWNPRMLRSPILDFPMRRRRLPRHRTAPLEMAGFTGLVVLLARLSLRWAKIQLWTPRTRQASVGVVACSTSDDLAWIRPSLCVCVWVCARPP